MQRKFMKIFAPSTLMAFALLVGAISSCSKEDNPESGTEQVSEVKEYPISLELIAGGEESSLAQTAETASEGRMFTLEPKPGDPSKFQIAQGSQWDAHVFFKNKTTGALGYVPYTFKYKSRGTNGVINLESVNTTVNISMYDGAAAPTDAEVKAGQWYITAVLGGSTPYTTRRVGSRIKRTLSKTLTYTTAKASTVGPNQIVAPNVANWVQLTMRGTSYKADLAFKPQGTVVAVNATNSTGGNITNVYDAGWIRPSGGAYTSARYDFATISVGTTPTYTPSTTHSYIPLKHPAANNGKSSTHYLWFATVTGQSANIVVEPSGYAVWKTSTYAGAKKQVDFTGTKLVSGSRTTINITVERPTKMPIEYISNLALAGGSTMTFSNKTGLTGAAGTLRTVTISDTSPNTQYGYYSGYVVAGRTEATYNPAGTNLGTQFASTLSSVAATHRFPVFSDFWGVLPNRAEIGPQTISAQSTGEMVKARFPRVDSIFFYGAAQWATSAVTVGNSLVTYGLRMLPGAINTPTTLQSPDKMLYRGGITTSVSYNASNPTYNPTVYRLSDYSHASACRMAAVGTFTGGSTPDRIVIEMVLLGEAARTTTLTDISNETWWNNKRTAGQVKKVILPVPGRSNHDNSNDDTAGLLTNPRWNNPKKIEMYGQAGLFWTTDYEGNSTWYILNDVDQKRDYARNAYVQRQQATSLSMDMGYPGGSYLAGRTGTVMGVGGTVLLIKKN